MQRVKCKIVRVIDGDSCVVEFTFENEMLKTKTIHDRPVRLAGIDAPKPGSGATAITAKLHLSRYVGIMIEMDFHGFDKYERFLGTFWTNDSKSINQELLDLGLAKPYSGGKRTA